MVSEPDNPERLAFIGVRVCELNAINIQDQVFLGGHSDRRYQLRRKQTFIVGVNCTQAGGT